MSALNTISITDRGDPRIAPFVSIRERDLTGGTDGLFIVEGKVPLSILLTRSRFDLHSLFLCETRLTPLADLLQQVSPEVPIYTAPQSLMDEIAGFPIHRGVLACARKGADLGLDSLFASQRLLVLNQISNHDNVGAAFRNAAAFGADGVILDAGSCDPLYRKAIRVSSGSSLWLPYHRGDTGAEHISALKQAGFDVWAMTPRAGAASLHTLKPPPKLAILLGAEGPGLPQALIGAAKPVRIPMRPGFDSVNVATAGAIALAHVFNSG
ncbi:MAG: RNA methyltransferase [Hyphomonadaceae bacterium]|nr:RNA methyltransferase [Hyphomonadaceae bacterium]